MGDMRLITLLPLVLIGCGPLASAPPPVPPAAARPVVTPGFETYVTDHIGFSRVRRSYAPGAAAMAAAASPSAASPAALRSLVALDPSLYQGFTDVEVMAEVAGPDGPVTRLVRLTVDQAPFSNERGGAPIAATGMFYLRGAHYTWVTVDDGPVLSGQSQRGLEHMVLDFDRESVSLILRTGVDAQSQVRTDLVAEDLPLDVVSGAFGGAVAMRVWVEGTPEILTAEGSLRGQLGGSPEYGTGRHEMSTSGLYFGEGTDPASGRHVRLDGVFVGRDPNVLP